MKNIWKKANEIFLVFVFLFVQVNTIKHLSFDFALVRKKYNLKFFLQKLYVVTVKTHRNILSHVQTERVKERKSNIHMTGRQKDSLSLSLDLSHLPCQCQPNIKFLFLSGTQCIVFEIVIYV